MISIHVDSKLNIFQYFPFYYTQFFQFQKKVDGTGSLGKSQKTIKMIRSFFKNCSNFIQLLHKLFKRLDSHMRQPRTMITLYQINNLLIYNEVFRCQKGSIHKYKICLFRESFNKASSLFLHKICISSKSMQTKNFCFPHFYIFLTSIKQFRIQQSLLAIIKLLTLIIFILIKNLMNTTKSVPNDFEIQKGTTWIGGPTHQLQRQHVPGYSGHIHGLHAQNVHGKNFARVTGECLNKRNTIGLDLQSDQKFKTSYKAEFNKPDLRRNQLITQAQRLLEKITVIQQAINQQGLEDYRKQPKSIEQVAPIDRIPVVGYQGFKPKYRPPQKQVKAPEEPEYIQLPEKKILQDMLQTGNVDQTILDKISKSEPIVGYGGFLKGIKSGNQYGQTFNQLARTSIQK